jgi:hypothetical protein
MHQTGDLVAAAAHAARHNDRPLVSSGVEWLLTRPPIATAARPSFECSFAKAF